MDQKTKDEMDHWVKEFQRRLVRLENLYGQINEDHNNIEHNYELIQQLKKRIRYLDQKIGFLYFIEEAKLKQRNILKK